MLQDRTAAKRTVMSKPVASVTQPVHENQPDSEVERLKSELSAIKAEMNNLKVAAAAEVETKSSNSEHATENKYKRNIAPQRPQLNDQPGVFCYRCGEDGHYMRECQGAENLQRVNKRLIKLTKKSGNYHGAQ